MFNRKIVILGICFLAILVVFFYLSWEISSKPVKQVNKTVPQAMSNQVLSFDPKIIEQRQQLVKVGENQVINPKTYYIQMNNWLSDHYDIFYFDPACLRIGPKEIEIRYRFDDQEIEAMTQKWNAEIQRMLHQLPKTEDEFSKVEAIHNLLISQTSYLEESTNNQEVYLSHTAYGAIVNRRAVCNGYAKAAAFLLQQAGIENRLVNGTYHGIPHTWNEYTIHGEKWYMDVTLDTGSKSGKEYLHLTYDQIMKDHQKE